MADIWEVVQPRLVVTIVTMGEKPESLRRLLNQLKDQTLPRERWEPVVWQKTEYDMNAYDQMNKAIRASKFQDPADVIITLGQDHEARDPDFLAKGLSYFEKDPDLMVQTVCVEGNVWGHGWERDDRPMLGPGGGLWVRRRAWERVGGFETDWGLGKPQLSWRSDSMMLSRVIDEFGPGSYRNTPEVTVVHEGTAQSPWVPLVEREFWRREKHHIRKYMLPIDPRLAQMVIAATEAGDENSAEDLMACSKVIEEFVAKGISRETFDDGIKQLRQLFETYDRSKL